MTSLCFVFQLILSLVVILVFIFHHMVTRSLFLFMFREISFLLFFLIIKLETVLSADRQFEACLPYNCGRGPNISYPFWINGNQNSSCGFPGFELFCKNREPILKMSGNEYVIREIFHPNQSFFMTKFGESNMCSPDTYRLSFARLPFSYVHSKVNLFIFFNCSAAFSTEYLRYSFGCATNNLRRHSLALFSDNPRLTYVRQLGQCEDSEFTPVVHIGNGSLNTSMMPREYIEEFLSDGFYLKWNASTCDECAASGGRCGFNYTLFKFMCFCADRPHHRWCRNSTDTTSIGSVTKPESKTGMKIAIGIAAGVGSILITSIAFICYLRRKRNKLNSSSALISRSISGNPSSKQDLEQGSIYFQTPIFTYKELDEATNHFDTNKELGDGGFGTVYHGKLRDGRAVAVKRLFEHNYKRVEQFMNEIVILSRLRHQNLVSLYGCTNRHSRELLLVYEYVPNGTVADHLHGNLAENGLLTWRIRMSIAIESADALAYLHASDVVHRDVKTNNILLDKDFHVKVADFGLSRLFPLDVTHVSTAPQGTPGYVDPEYYQCYQLNDKSDVYSFGVVLIELISSKPAVDIGRHRHEINLANMAINKIHNRELHELVDPTLGFDSDYGTKNMITLVAELAFRCLQQEKEMRPCMTEVLETLKGIENEDYKKKMDELDIPADACLLKKNQPLSPDSVTDKWVSKSSTPNTSG